MTKPDPPSEARDTRRRWLFGALVGVVAGASVFFVGLAPVFLVAIAGALLVVGVLGRREPAFASGLLVAVGATLFPSAGRQLAMCSELYSGCTPELLALAIGAGLSLVVGLAFGAVVVRGSHR
jgi:hypothetical protein